MGILSNIKRFFDSLNARKMEKRMEYFIRYNQLVSDALHSSTPGVSDDCKCGHEVIVSLTTYGKRLYEVAATIESIMQGSLRPNRIVLWLEEDLKNVTLPIALQCQQKRGLEIAYCKDLLSYKKLIPTLRKYPEAAIITIDDDAIYHFDLVENMVNCHKKYPQNVIANRVTCIRMGADRRPLSYRKWKGIPLTIDASHFNFATGVGGILYPPHSLHPEVTNEEVFMDICKHADDVWFYAMALMNGTMVRKCPTHSANGEDYLNNFAVQDTALFKRNVSRSKSQPCGNDIQLKAVMDKYELWDKLRIDLKQ